MDLGTGKVDYRVRLTSLVFADTVASECCHITALECFAFTGGIVCALFSCLLYLHVYSHPA